MENFKFKGQRKDNNDWIEGDLIKLKNFNNETDYFILPDTFEINWSKNNIAEQILGSFIEIIPETIIFLK